MLLAEMQPIYTTIDAGLPIMILPDSMAHFNGHSILTYTYSIYKDISGHDKGTITNKEEKLHLEKKNDPNYMGFITFEVPGKLFYYTADGSNNLTADEVEQIIELVTQYRDNPDTWRL